MNLISDCGLLNSLENNDDFSLPFKQDLIEKLYSDDYSFNDEEFLILAEQLNYLDCNRLDEILIFIKIKGICPNSLNEDLQNRIENIKIYENTFNTFIKENKLKVVKWLYHNYSKL